MQRMDARVNESIPSEEIRREASPGGGGTAADRHRPAPSPRRKKACPSTPACLLCLRSQQPIRPTSSGHQRAQKHAAFTRGGKKNCDQNSEVIAIVTPLYSSLSCFCRDFITHSGILFPDGLVLSDVTTTARCTQATTSLQSHCTLDSTHTGRKREARIVIV